MLGALSRAAAALVLLTGAAAAADIAVSDEDGRPLVRIEGEIALGDAARFERAVAPLDRAVVVLSGPGGKLIDALTIGEMIHARRFDTRVEEGDSCTSACALVWIAGTERALEDGGAIGFHAASARENGAARVTSSGNAIVGAYLTRLGFPLAVVVMATEADFTSMAYLTADKAASSGLAYRRVTRVPRAVSAKAVVAAAQGTGGPSDLAIAAKAPADAAEFVDFYFATVNAAPSALRALVGRTYADMIVYYGETIGRRELIRRREKKLRIWPDYRLTRTRPAEIGCSVTGDSCVVIGEASFSGRASPGESPTGTLTYELTVVRADGWFRVTSERTDVGARSTAMTLAAALQRALEHAGCTPGAADGVWGPKSRAALERFADNSRLPLGGTPTDSALAIVTAAPGSNCGDADGEVQARGESRARPPG